MSLPLLLLLACKSASITLDDSGPGGDGGAGDGGAGDGGSGDGGSADGGSGDGGSADGGSGDGGSADGGSGDGGDDGGGGDGGDPTPAPDYRLAGPYTVGSADGSSSVNGCTMNWTTFTPAGAPALPPVIFAHGFMRSRAQHVDTAAHLASWGLTVVTVDLCHSNILDVDHAQNAADMVALGANLAGGDVLYAGHSAGGLSAVLAGAQAPGSRGVVALDPVDVDNLGLDAATGVSVPVRALFGESNACNSDNNGIPVVTMVPDGQLLRVTDADHCDFESNTDWLCTLTCTGGNESFSDEEIAATARGLATAALLDLSGGAPEAGQWWTPGEAWYAELLGTGAVSLP